MASFKDRNGKTWTVEVDVNQVKRLRSMLNVDLLEVLTDGKQVIQQLVEDPVMLVDTLYVLCQAQADSCGVTDEQFGSALAGDAIESASSALMEAIADFFPRGRRENLQAVVAKVRKAQEASEARTLKLMGGPEIDLAIERQLAMAEKRFLSDLDEIGGN